MIQDLCKEIYFGFCIVVEEDKVGLVYGVFLCVVLCYDVMNDLMSVGIYCIWKIVMMDWLVLCDGQYLLDVVGGMGDIVFCFFECVLGVCVIVCDMIEFMLVEGCKCVEVECLLDCLVWVMGDVMKLFFVDESFDCYMISFGICNVICIFDVLVEVWCVLKFGGCLMVLEFSQMLVLML